MHSSQRITIVLVDSKESDALETKSALDPTQFDCKYFLNGHDAVEYCLKATSLDLVITEYRLEGVGGLELIETLKEHRSNLPIIMMSRETQSNVAIQAVQSGAHDFLPKPCPPNELTSVVLEAIRGQETNLKSTAEFGKSGMEDESNLVGNSRAMAKLYRDIAKLAATPFSTLVQGETGSGKELVARAIHQYGHRGHKPFIAVNCAAIPEMLLESELFGHEKGAFTGAVNQKIGKFEQAHGATLFLDEIGDMQPLLQAKMLRVLQEKVIQRVGGKQEIPVDVKIITATHQNLNKMVQDGTFRADLLYRLHSSTLKIPPLRDRLGDIALLTQHFLIKFSQQIGIEQPLISQNALSLLERQYWHGNVRQLQNVIRQALLKRRNLQIDADDIEEILSNEISHAADTTSDSLRDLVSAALEQAKQEENPFAHQALIQHVEHVLFTEALKQSGGNLAKAARWLGITRFTLREKMKKSAKA